MYEPRKPKEIAEAERRTREREVVRVVAEYEGDQTMTWVELSLSHSVGVIRLAKAICVKRGTHPRPVIWLTNHRKSGRW